MTRRIGGLVLAAGASTRLGEPKQLLIGPDGRPLVSGVVHALRKAGCDPIVVVVGAHADAVTHALIDDAAAVWLVPHRGWAEGMGSSIRAGIASMSVHGMMTDVAAVLIATCDMPAADHAHFAALRAAALLAATPPGTTRPGATPPGAVWARVASTYASSAGQVVARGNPAVFPRRDWPALLQLEGDRGAKALLEEPDTLTVPLGGGSFDLDTPADVAAWRAGSAPPSAIGALPSPDVPTDRCP